MRTLGLVALLFAACGSDRESPARTGPDAGADAGEEADSRRCYFQNAYGGTLRMTVDGVLRQGEALAQVQCVGFPGARTSVTVIFPGEPNMSGANISIHWAGASTGSLAIDRDELSIDWFEGGNTHGCGAGRVPSRCTLDLSAYDETLKQGMAGTFSATLTHLRGTEHGPVEITDGTFEVPAQ